MHNRDPTLMGSWENSKEIFLVTIFCLELVLLLLLLLLLLFYYSSGLDQRGYVLITGTRKSELFNQFSLSFCREVSELFCPL